MKHLLLILKLVVLAYLGYLVWFFIITDGPAAPGYNPPFLLWVMDTINLFIHEAGHFFFKPFGMWIHILGGSFVQCLLPLLLAVVTWKQNVSHVAYPAFWLGENLINVSYYIQDAPNRKLKLIAAGLIHDWNWLLSGNLYAAESIGTVVWVFGFVVCLSAVGAGGWFAMQAFRECADDVEMEN